MVMQAINENTKKVEELKSVDGKLIVTGSSGGGIGYESVNIKDPGGDIADVRPASDMEGGRAGLQTDAEISASVPMMVGGTNDGSTMDSAHFQPDINISEGKVVVTNALWKLDKGELFLYDTKKKSVAAGSSYKILFHTPAGVDIRLLSWSLNVDQDAEMTFYESPDSPSGGTTPTDMPVNKNRASTATAGTTFTEDVSTTADGTYLESVFWNAASATNKTSLSEDGSEEWKLNPDTDYLIVITNNDASNAMNCQVKLIFTEE